MHFRSRLVLDDLANILSASLVLEIALDFLVNDHHDAGVDRADRRDILDENYEFFCIVFVHLGQAAELG